MSAERPPWCGDPACDPTTRLVETDDDRMAHCPRCHPLAPASLDGLRRRRQQLQGLIEEVDRLIADAETAASAPPWVRGRGVRS